MRRFLTLLLALTLTLSVTGYAAAASADGADAAWDGTLTVGGLEDEKWTSRYGNLFCDCTAERFFDELGFAWGDLVTVSVLGKTVTVPVVPGHTYVESGAGAVVVEKDTEGKPTEKVTLIINMGSFIEAFGIATRQTNADGSLRWEACDGVTFPLAIHFALEEAGGYMAEYLLHDLQRTNKRSDYAALDDRQYANFRAVCTTGMGENALYRSSSPVDPELERNAYADAAARGAGVKTILNLADDSKTLVEHKGFAKTYYSGQNILPLGLGADYSAADYRENLADGFRFLAAHEGPYLVHCTEGKDRAGYVTALLECLMGASADEVIADYMVSYYNYYGVEPDTEKYTAIAAGNIVRSLKDTFGVDDLAAADLAAEAAEYLAEIGLSGDEIAALKSSLSASFDPAVFDASEVYIVVSGDCLWSIARRYYGSGAYYAKIAEANDLPNADRIYVGQVLSIPTL